MNNIHKIRLVFIETSTHLSVIQLLDRILVINQQTIHALRIFHTIEM